jgi:hypothetical protein
MSREHDPSLQPNQLPPELAAFLQRQHYACLLHPTDQGAVYVVKAPGADIESLRGRVPVQVHHELYEHPASPVIRTLFRWYDRPASPLAMESYTNVGDPQQRTDYLDLSRRDQLRFLFYDEQLAYRLSKLVHHPDRRLIPQIVAIADRLLLAIPSDRRDFDQAKAAVIQRTSL